MVVIQVPPLDFFEGATLTVDEWLNKADNRLECMEEFMEAVVAASCHELWEWRLRCEPRVAYDFTEDEPYFIFKLDNNGTTFLVGESVAVGEVRGITG